MKIITKQIEHSIKTFKDITNIDVTLKTMKSGVTHVPSILNKNKQGVYVFCFDDTCLKVGKAGPRSQARWNSHHYNLDETTKSALTKTIKKHTKSFASLFPKERRSEIEALNKSNFPNWIKNNLDRFELIIDSHYGKYALNLLESMVQFHCSPFFEGKFDTAKKNE